MHETDLKSVQGPLQASMTPVGVVIATSLDYLGIPIGTQMICKKHRQRNVHKALATKRTTECHQHHSTIYIVYR